MVKKILAVIVVWLLLALTIGAFSSISANAVDKNPVEPANDEGPCSIKVSFVTNKKEEYLYEASFRITLIFSFEKKEYHLWEVVKESGESSIEVTDLPSGLYKLYNWGFTVGYIGGLPRYVYVGNGKIISTHKDITLKIIDLSRP